MRKFITIGLVFILLIYIIPLSTLITKKEKKIFNGETISVYDTDTDEVLKVSLEEYVLKALSKEMPASFEKEALKAQAVAIRTYTLKKKQTKNEKHENAVVCTDSNHCMAYMKEEIEEKYREKLEGAVLETSGQVLMFDKEYASTVFHAISSGQTENSEDIWGGEVPYLVSVESLDDIKVKGYETKVTVSYNEFINKLGAKDFEKVIGEEQRTEAGTVKTITLCEKEYTGAKVRELFNLRSSNFKIEEDDGNYIFTVYGYGHGVGMSQHGANNYAKAGYTYEEILNHYYPGTELKEAV